MHLSPTPEVCNNFGQAADHILGVYGFISQQHLAGYTA
jgi:hypothetical protein